MTRIFKAARIVTQTGESPEALATVDQRIVATGTFSDLRALLPEAAVTDLGETVVVPGFNDAHGHIGIVAEDALYLDLSWDVVRSHAEMIESIRNEASRTPAGEWLRATRYDDAKMGVGRILSRWELDEISREHPMFIHHVAGHWCVVNSKALEIAGIDESTEDPSGGRIDRDANGRLNGILHERAMEIFWPFSTEGGRGLMPVASLEDRLRGFARVQKEFHASGITSLTDALVQPHDIALFEEARRLGLLSMRLNMLVAYGAYDTVRASMRSKSGDERLRLGGVKAFVDGAIGGRTCLMEEPFEGTTDDFGIQSTSDAELNDIVRMVHGDGNRICVHANGDRAIRKLLTVLEAASDEKPQPGLRHRIEHCSIVAEDIVDRIQRLRAIVTPFGSYVYYHGAKLLDWYGPKRIERMFAHRTFFDNGITVAGSSDYPCGPYQPLLAMQSCVTRTGFDGTPLGLSQRISAEEALTLYTVNGAIGSGEQHEKGKLAPGFLADFVVLGADPRAVEPSAIGAIPIRATYVGAEAVWEATT